MNEHTIVSLFADRIKNSGQLSALWIKRGGQYEGVSWNRLAEQVGRTAAALVRLGVEPGDRVIQLSENRYEWIVCDLAIQLAQAVHVPVHAPLTGAQIALQLQDSGARIAIFSTPQQAAKLASSATELPDDLQLLSIEPCQAAIGSRQVRLLSDACRGVAEAEARRVVRQALDQLTPDSLATILYTSGTTGEPKGVMLSQRNLVSNTLGTLDMLGTQQEETRLNFLPLSHVFARTCDLYTWIAQGSRLALAESRETVLADCAAIRPTLISGVPYFFERVCRELSEQRREDQPGALRELLGGRIRLCFSGGAALPDHVFDFFHDRGVPLLQGYGLTETSPVITVSSQESFRRGSVGRPIPGVEVRIAADGEILTRGPHVMLGYYKREQATAEIIKQGWLHTGDLGRADEDGFLFITGRKKELIVTAGGKNVVPVYLESLLTADPLIVQAMVVGDGRNFLAALIVPHPDLLRDQIEALGLGVSSPREALVHPDVLALFEQRVRERLSGLSHYEQVQKITLLERAFSIEQGELTPKLSLRRDSIERNFRDRIEAMYRRG